MAGLSVCLFLVVFAFAKAATTSNNGLVRNAYAVLTEPSPKETKKDGDQCDAESLNQMLCENDRLQFCGPNNQIMSMPCALNGKPGFCNCEKTGCVVRKPVCPDDTSKCLVPNTKLPDYTNCQRFTYCNAESQKITLECPIGLVYSPKDEKCVDRTMARCSRITCPRTSMLELIPFPQATNYYVLCFQGVGDVRKCPDKFYGVRNNVCQFDCSLKGVSGVFRDPNPNMCRRGIYYVCKKGGMNFSTIQANCPAGLTFDEKLGVCTKEDTCSETNETL